jgi:hypothetical protein
MEMKGVTEVTDMSKIISIVNDLLKSDNIVDKTKQGKGTSTRAIIEDLVSSDASVV